MVAHFIKLTLPLAVLLLAACGGGGGGGGTPLASEPARGELTLRGTIAVTSGSVTDSDTNDTNAPSAPNDTPKTAQLIPGSATVGGFVSAVPTYNRNDRFAASGDLFDSYRVNLTKGQSVSLTISDYIDTLPSDVDIDLYLFSAIEPITFVGSSLGVNRVESLTIPADGEYIIVVHAFNGLSNYILTLEGATATTGSLGVLRLEDGFKTGEVIAKLRPTAGTGAKNSADTLSAVAGTLGMEVLQDGAGRPSLLGIGTASTTASRNASGCCFPFDGSFGYTLTPEQQAAFQTISAIKQLRGNNEVAYAEPNYLRQAFALPDDPEYAQQWHYPLINLPQAWDLTTGDRSVIVAVVDTGVFMSHPDLAANLLDSGYDMISDLDNALDGDAIDPNPDDPGDGLNPGTSSYHGTHVAGTVAAVSNNQLGTAGSAQSVSIMPVRVLGRNGATSYDIIQAIRYAAGLRNDSGTTPAAPADIINLSLGGLGYSSATRETIDEAREAGAIIVAAAGNSGSSSPMYPASYDGVISVSAITPDQSLASYSNYGNAIDVAAPGGDLSMDLNRDGLPDGVLSTWVDDSSGTRQADYQFMNGTSMAAPHVAGVIALMKSVYPQLTPTDVDVLLATGAMTDDLQNDGPNVRNNQFGYGMVNALKAVQQASALASGSQLPTIPVATPSNGSLSYTLNSIELALSQLGDDEIQVISYETDKGWASLSPQSVDGNAFGSYLLSIDRTGLSPGSHQVSASFHTSNGQRVSAMVTVKVSQPVDEANAGHHYVLLIDADSDQVVTSSEADASNGIYRFTLNQVPEGRYYILSGSDNDKDHNICDTGEACGGYPHLNQLEIIDVMADQNDLDFTTSYSAHQASARATSG